MTNLTQKKQIEIENNYLIDRLIYHSLEINVCKKLRLKYKNLRPMTKVLLGNSHYSMQLLMNVQLDLTSIIEKHQKIIRKLTNRFIQINELEEKIKSEEIAPFGTIDLKRGYVELFSLENRNYFIILNQRMIINDTAENYKMYLSNCYSVIPKGYLILFN